MLPPPAHHLDVQPVQGDWRKRFGGGKSSDGKVKKTSSSAPAPAAAPAQPTYPKKSKTKPDLEALSHGLPSGWTAVWKAATGDIYYENKSTKVWACVGSVGGG